MKVVVCSFGWISIAFLATDTTQEDSPAHSTSVQVLIKKKYVLPSEL